MRTLKELVANSQVSRFAYYKEGALYYDALYSMDDADSSMEYYRFPVPIEDTDKGKFPAIIKSATLMRWIRKAIEDNTLVKV